MSIPVNAVSPEVLGSYDAILAEQAEVQAEKFQGRTLDEYSAYLFPGQRWARPRNSPAADFVRPITGDIERITLEAVLAGLQQTMDRKISWVDMGAGRALAMRQLAAQADIGSMVTMTNVDLFHYGLHGLDPYELDYLEGRVPGITDPVTEPTAIRDNAETVDLPEPVDVITSFELMQYLNDPLAAMANWYNQLTDNGLMMVSAEHDWSSWIRYPRKPGTGMGDETPTKHLLEVLSEKDIPFAITADCDWENGVRPDVDPSSFRNFIVQKKAGTRWEATKPAVKIWKNPFNYKAVYYELANHAADSPIQIVDDPAYSLGGIGLKGAA